MQTFLQYGLSDSLTSLAKEPSHSLNKVFPCDVSIRSLADRFEVIVRDGKYGSGLKDIKLKVNETDKGLYLLLISELHNTSKLYFFDKDSFYVKDITWDIKVSKRSDKAVITLWRMKSRRNDLSNSIDREEVLRLRKLRRKHKSEAKKKAKGNAKMKISELMCVSDECATLLHLKLA